MIQRERFDDKKTHRSPPGQTAMMSSQSQLPAKQNSESNIWPLRA
jgi:hypothetical protein